MLIISKIKIQSQGTLRLLQENASRDLHLPFIVPFFGPQQVNKTSQKSPLNKALPYLETPDPVETNSRDQKESLLSPLPAMTAELTPSIEEQALTSPGPFEGPEKLLEVWFAPSIEELPSAEEVEGKVAGGLKARPAKENGEWQGLRKVPREVWEEMLDIVKCKVLSMVEGDDLDAYLLSCVLHSSFLFITANGVFN